MDFRRIAINISDPERATMQSPGDGNIKSLNEFWATESEISPGEADPIYRALEGVSSTTKAMLIIAGWLGSMEDETGAGIMRNFAKKYSMHEIETI